MIIRKIKCPDLELGDETQCHQRLLQLHCAGKVPSILLHSRPPFSSSAPCLERCNLDSICPVLNSMAFPTQFPTVVQIPCTQRLPVKWVEICSCLKERKFSNAHFPYFLKIKAMKSLSILSSMLASQKRPAVKRPRRIPSQWLCD